MEIVVIILVVCLILISFGLLGVMVWQNHDHRRQIDELTSKIVAKSLGDYAFARQTEKSKPEPKPEEKKKLKDPVLGDIY